MHSLGRIAAAIAVVTGAFFVLGPTTSLAALQMHATREQAPVGSDESSSTILTGIPYGPRPEQLLDLHLPAGRPGPFPVIVERAPRRLDRRNPHQRP
jgi:hypothetical protein